MKISVITATLNAERTLRSALQSLSSQTHKNYEHIIVDGGSTDRTLSMAQELKDERTKILGARRLGLYDALNLGIHNSTGEVIGFLHADDAFYDQNSLGKIADTFNAGKPDVCYGDLVYLSKHPAGKVVRYWSDGPYRAGSLNHGWMAAHPTLYATRDVYRRIGGYDSSYRISADYDFILRLFKDETLEKAYLPHPLYKMTLGGVSNGSAKSLLIKYREDLRAIRHNGLSGLWTLSCKNFRKLRQLSARPYDSNLEVTS